MNIIRFTLINYADLMAGHAKCRIRGHGHSVRDITAIAWGILQNEIGNENINSDLMGIEVVKDHQITHMITGEDSFIITVTWPKGIHVYGFWKNKDGRYKYSLSEVFPHTRSVLVGDCSYIDFGWMQEYDDEQK